MRRPLRSLRWRLTVAVTAVLGLSLGVFSLVLHAAFGRALWRQFDARLAEDAHAVANMVEERAQGPWDFEIEAGPQRELGRWRGPTYFEVWMDDGSVLARSPSLGATHLRRRARGDGLAFADAALPDGRPGRLLQASLPPRRDESSPARPSGRRVTVVVARPVAELDTTMATLRLFLLGLGATALVLAGLAGILAVRAGLKPLDRLTMQVDAIDARRLAERLPLEDLPGELQPAVRKLNELLGRLEEAFLREQQFSADVAHELRTPLAGLRTTLEVTSSRDRAPAEYRAAIGEALAIVRGTAGLVENLLMLVRLDAGEVEVGREAVQLHELVEERLLPLTARARERGLTVENQVPPGATIISDRDKLGMVAANLLGNAVEHTAEHGRVTVSSDPARGTLIEVEDSGPPIPDGALERIFDRFFRLEPSRSGGEEHSGIGLALVRALCEAMGLSVSAKNTVEGGVTFKVAVEGAASDPARAALIPGEARPVKRT